MKSLPPPILPKITSSLELVTFTSHIHREMMDTHRWCAYDSKYHQHRFWLVGDTVLLSGLNSEVREGKTELFLTAL